MKHLRAIDGWVMPLVLMVAYFYALYSILPIFADGDAAWHLASGDVFRSFGGVPPVEPWAFTSGGEKWHPLSWLFDVWISYWGQWFGFAGLYLLMVIILCLISVTLYWDCRARSGSVFSTALVVILAAVTLSFSMFLRPQIVTYLLLAVAHILMHRDDLDRRNSIFIILPLLTLLWSNLHGGVLALLCVLGAYGLQALVLRDRAQVIRLGGLTVICLLASLLTPHGGVGMVIGILGGMVSTMNDYIAEWRPLEPFQAVSQGVFLCLFILVSHFGNGKIPLADRILAFMWLLFALLSRRHFPIFVILAAPYMVLSLDEILSKVKAYFNLSKGMPEVNQLRGAFGCIPLLLALIFLMVASFFYVHFADPHRYARQSKPLSEAVEYIAQTYPDANVFNRYNDGGQIIFLARQRFKIAIDGRIDMAYSPDFIAEYAKVIQPLGQGWLEAAQKYGTQIFLLPEGSGMEKALREYEGEWIWDKSFEDGAGRYGSIKYYVIVHKSLYQKS